MNSKAMNTQAYFDDIQVHILHEIGKAENSVHIAVAWFTDYEIFELLCLKAAQGIRVELLITKDSINLNSPLDYQKLVDAGGMFLMVGDKKRRSTIMHNKFCVIDAKTILNGSYNWSKSARENWENIVVISNAPELARQYLDEFENILNHEAGQAIGRIDYSKIVIRLEALKSFLEIEDEDDINLQLSKLMKLIPVDDDEFAEPLEIIRLIECGDYNQALNSINSYVSTRKQIVLYTDPEIPLLKFELASLEIQVAALEDEKADIEKLLHSYNYRHAIEVGELIQRILFLRREKLKAEAEQDESKQEEYQEAQQDYDEYNQDFEESSKRELYKVTDAEQQELKATFRACSKMCHPDVVAAEYKSEAAKIFARLNEANEKNDIPAVKAIYEQLQKGIFVPMSATVSDAQKLHKQVVRIRGKVKELSVAISAIRTADAYRKVVAIKDWDEYFATMKQQLLTELDRLEAAMK